MTGTILICETTKHGNLAPSRRIVWILVLFLATSRMLGQGFDLNENWDSRFFPSGSIEITDSIATLKVSSNGELYVGGKFKQIGGDNRYNALAKWDGIEWKGIGAGFKGDALIRKIILEGDIIYAAGTFSLSGDMPLQNLAQFDGTNWLDVGGGVGGTIQTMSKAGADLYVGGFFTNAGGIAVNNIARWDGSRWHDLQGGVSGRVWAITPGPNNLIYVGGYFTNAGGQPASRIAAWDGSKWSALGAGISAANIRDPGVYSIAVHGTDVYAGGEFSRAGDEPVNHLARWDGSTWHDVGGGIQSQSRGIGGRVNELAVVDGELYVAGAYTVAGDVPSYGLAKWNGENWFSLASDLIQEASTLTVHAGAIYVVSPFLNNPVTPNYRGIAKFESNRWHLVGAGLSHFGGGDGNSVNTIALGPGGVYIGGLFYRRYGINPSDRVASQLALWDNARWHFVGGKPPAMTPTVGGTAKPSIETAIYTGNSLIIGGSFLRVLTNEMPYVAVWDGTNWSSLGNGLESTVRTLAAKGSLIYAGGDFGISQWDGEKWSSLGSGISGTVNSISLQGDHLFAGGSFETAGGKSIRYLARWSDGDWHSVGPELDAPVHALLSDGSNVYVGGAFTNAGEVALHAIGRWDGSAFRTLGVGLGGGSRSRVLSLALSEKGDLFVGGLFKTAGGIVATNIAKWSKEKWSSLGSGVSDSDLSSEVRALAWRDGKLYVGGTFYEVGGNESVRFAIWHEPAELVPPVLSAKFESLKQIKLLFQGEGTNVFVLESSEDLIQWRPTHTNILQGGKAELTIELDNSIHRFYRAIVPSSN